MAADIKLRISVEDRVYGSPVVHTKGASTSAEGDNTLKQRLSTCEPQPPWGSIDSFTGVKYQISTLQFIAVANLQL